jgi:uncharacterized protein YkwD
MSSRICLSRRALGLSLLALFCLSAASAVRGEGDDVRALLRQFRNQNAEWDVRDAAARELLGAGAEGALPLAKAATAEFNQRHKKWIKEEAAYLRAFESASEKAGIARTHKAPAEEVAAQREQLLKYSRSRGLSKAQVEKKCDPALRALEDLLEVSVEDVLEPGSKIKEQRGELLDEAMDLEWLAELCGHGRSFISAEEAVKIIPVEFDSNVYRRIREHEGLMTLSGVATSASDKGALAFNYALAAELGAEEFKGLYELNRIRILAGIGALKIDVKLCNAGRGHSKDMVEHDFFDHTSPLPGKTSPGDRSRLAGTSGGAENIAAGQETGEDAIRAWWYSPGHHRNMMGGHARCGLGQHQDHWTQMFG